MSDPYLILHKVRGEPAFDIAVRLETGEEMWIIPTSGHRAYPLFFWELKMLSAVDGWSDPIEAEPTIHPRWEYLPDHYQVSEAPHKVAVRQGMVNNLLAAIGRAPKPIQRRKVGDG